MKLIATSMTIGYEDGSKLVVEGARANNLIEWWFNMCVSKWGNRNNLDDALCQMEAKFVHPDGVSRQFSNFDSIQ